MKGGRLVAVLLLLAGAAGAQPKGKRNAVSHKPFALASSGVVVQYERYLAERWSALAGLGARRAAREDFRSVTLSFVSEGRFWLSRRDWASDYRGMAGPYLSVAADAARTRVTYVPTDRDVGAAWRIQESLRFGNRFVIWNLQEITPAASLDVIHDFDEQGRLAPGTRTTLGLDFTVGWVF
ncbi:MAG: hypothetical protein IT375_15095 [Polyangiaceae bacterium]|nr:hypothetical protein [Polyangiaceae bacterium]